MIQRELRSPTHRPNEVADSLDEAKVGWPTTSWLAAKENFRLLGHLNLAGGDNCLRSSHIKRAISSALGYYGGRLSRETRRRMPPNFPFLQTSACSLTCSLLRSIKTWWSVPRLPRSSPVTMATVGGCTQWPSFNRIKGRASRRPSLRKLKIASLRWAARRSICTYDHRTPE
jgi:hypothetical protein